MTARPTSAPTLAALNAGSKATKQQRPGKQLRLNRAPQQQQQKPSTLQPKKASGPKKRRVPTNRFRGATL